MGFGDWLKKTGKRIATGARKVGDFVSTNVKKVGSFIEQPLETIHNVSSWINNNPLAQGILDSASMLPYVGQVASAIQKGSKWAEKGSALAQHANEIAQKGAELYDNPYGIDNKKRAEMALHVIGNTKDLYQQAKGFREN